jgi:hypothetical protein
MWKNIDFDFNFNILINSERTINEIRINENNKKLITNNLLKIMNKSNNKIKN